MDEEHEARAHRDQQQCKVVVDIQIRVHDGHAHFEFDAENVNTLVERASPCAAIESVNACTHAEDKFGCVGVDGDELAG